MTGNRPRLVRCPTCGGDSIFAPSNPHRPFCSQRCRQIDLGQWSDESFRLPGTPAFDPLADQVTEPDISSRSRN
ncbi:MAG TPA: DNA gyrase inhibitor YacG [Burkholderiaceae bacterium]|nr:DNA gyrase inhibitor YacG [Burkholderiaceae bacterium]